ncbi:MAG: CRISPR-associated endonuclease Cas2 [Thiolinea sp.]
MARRKLPHIVCYDIRCPKRLGRVHRYLKKRAIPLQYSVFLAQLDEKKRDKVLRDLRVIINLQQDDVRIYPLPEKPEWCTLGKALWGSGLTLTGVELPRGDV